MRQNWFQTCDVCQNDHDRAVILTFLKTGYQATYLLTHTFISSYA